MDLVVSGTGLLERMNATSHKRDDHQVVSEISFLFGDMPFHSSSPAQIPSQKIFFILFLFFAIL